MGAKLQGLTARTEDDPLTAPTRVHAKDIHAPTRTIEVRNRPAPTWYTENGQFELRSVYEQTGPTYPIPSERAEDLSDNIHRMWDQQVAISGGARGTTYFGEDMRVSARMIYNPLNGYDLGYIDENRRVMLANEFQRFRIQRGNPQWFAVRVVTNGQDVGQMTLGVSVFAPRAPIIPDIESDWGLDSDSDSG
jgi:hypothetical protein